MVSAFEFLCAIQTLTMGSDGPLELHSDHIFYSDELLVAFSCYIYHNPPSLIELQFNEWKLSSI